MSSKTYGRRQLLSLGAAAAAGLALPKIAEAQQAPVLFNISSFRAANWQDYFQNRKNGVILADTKSRCVQYWSEDGQTHLLYPCSVPDAPELTRTGMTRVVQKVVGPTWHPTPSMLQRMPWLPKVVGPGPENPLGPYALYLSWQYYRIHGTQDTRKIGRASSDGCIGLYNEDIKVLFENAVVGTQVRLI